MKIKCPNCNHLIDFKIEEKTETFDIIPEFSLKKLFVKPEGLNFRRTPEIKEDNIITELKCGQEVVVISERGKWFEVECLNERGWVSCFYLTDEVPVVEERESKTKKDSVDDKLPKFVNGAPNLAGDVNTVKLRKIINDEFGGGTNNWCLQCTEYVQYKIQQIGITINWPNERPRHGGRWASIFESSGLYKVLNEPKAGCAMSFTSGLKNSNIGHVAFVEEIYNDNSIKISEANWPPSGKYCERVLSKPQWQDKYKCRFIDFT